MAMTIRETMWDSPYNSDFYLWDEALETWYHKKAGLFEKAVAKQMGALTYLQDFCEAMAYMCKDQLVNENYDFLEANGFEYEDAICYLYSIGHKQWEKEVEEAFNESIKRAYDPL